MATREPGTDFREQHLLVDAGADLEGYFLKFEHGRTIGAHAQPVTRKVYQFYDPPTHVFRLP